MSDLRVFRCRRLTCVTCGLPLEDGDLVVDTDGRLDHAKCVEAASLPAIGSPYRLLAPPIAKPARPIPTDGSISRFVGSRIDSVIFALAMSIIGGLVAWSVYVAVLFALSYVLGKR